MALAVAVLLFGPAFTRTTASPSLGSATCERTLLPSGVFCNSHNHNETLCNQSAHYILNTHKWQPCYYTESGSQHLCKGTHLGTHQDPSLPANATGAQECKAQQCSDGVQNGEETGIDCGEEECGSCSPSSSPTMAPTATPTTSPTMSPTTSPTTSPTAGPTTGPTAGPTTSPTTSPTAGPTTSPTMSPTAGPTTGPTAGPTTSPTTSPTAGPTTSPTIGPTAGPTTSPTLSPSGSPTGFHDVGTWALNETYFHVTKNVGDTIQFLYDPSHHNVMVVEDYDGTAPCTGGTHVPHDAVGSNFTFNKSTTYFFYCAFAPAHCQDGMHKTVTVLPKDDTYAASGKGDYNDPYDQMAAKNCQIGEYQDQTGQTMCKESATCPAGTYVDDYSVSHKVSATVDRTCQGCPVGRHTDQANQASCTLCSTRIANDARTGCTEDVEKTPEWVVPVAASLGGFAFLIIAVGIYIHVRRRKGYKKVDGEKQQAVARAPIGNMFY